MSRQCQLTGSKVSSGQNRPFSLKATKRTFRPNLFKKRILNPLTGRVERMKLSARAIRTLKKWAREAGIKEVKPKVLAEGAHSHNEEKGRVHKEKLTPKQKKELAAKKAETAKEEVKPTVVKEMEKATKKTEEKPAKKKAK